MPSSPNIVGLHMVVWPAILLAAGCAVTPSSRDRDLASRKRPLVERRRGLNPGDLMHGDPVPGGRAAYRILHDATVSNDVVSVPGFQKPKDGEVGLDHHPGLVRDGEAFLWSAGGLASDPVTVYLHSPRAVASLYESWSHAGSEYGFHDAGGVTQNVFAKEVRDQIQKAIVAYPGRDIEFRWSGKLALSERQRSNLVTLVRDMVYVNYRKQNEQRTGAEPGTLSEADRRLELPNDSEIRHLLLLTRGQGSIHEEGSDKEKVLRSLISTQISYPGRNLGLFPQSMRSLIEAQFRTSGSRGSVSFPSLPTTRRLKDTPENEKVWLKLMRTLGSDSYAELTRLSRFSDLEELPEPVKAAFYLRIFQLATDGPHPVRYLIGSLAPESLQSLSRVLGFKEVGKLQMADSKNNASDPGSRGRLETLALIDLQSPEVIQLMESYALSSKLVDRPLVGALYSSLLSQD